VAQLFSLGHETVWDFQRAGMAGEEFGSFADFGALAFVGQFSFGLRPFALRARFEPVDRCAF
jgi:hypothetical protein